MTTTGNDQDCYIDGEGYFVVANGALDSVTGVPGSGYLYTRVGDELTFDNHGYLTDGAGNYICGINNGGGASADLTASPTDVSLKNPDSSDRGIAAIRYDPANNMGSKGTGSKVTLTSAAVGSDGTITAQDSSGNVVTVGRIALAYFANPAGLTEEGNSMYSSVSGNAGTATYSVPGSGSVGKIVTGALESSGTDLANEFTNMIQYERGFQANTKLVTVSDEMLQTLVNMKQ